MMVAMVAMVTSVIVLFLMSNQTGGFSDFLNQQQSKAIGNLDQSGSEKNDRGFGSKTTVSGAEVSKKVNLGSFVQSGDSGG